MRALTLSALLLSLSGCGLSPLNSIFELAQRGPLPLTHPVPPAGMACVVKVSHALGSSGTWIDETMISPESWEPSDGNQRLVVVSAQDDGGMIFTVPSLNSGSVYQANQASVLSGNKASMGYSYSARLTDYSFSDSTSKAEITIDGNSQGWIWGSFDGSLGPLRSRTLILGKFTCRSGPQA